MRTAILPFLFIFNTQLLLIGLDGPLHVMLTMGSALVAMLVFAASTSGYFFARNRWYETLALLLVCFTLFRPGFWMDMMHPPFQELKGESMMQYIAAAPANTGKRVWVEGMNMDAKDIRKGVLIPLGAEGDAKKRLASAGLTVMPDGDTLQVIGVKFGSTAEKMGIEQSFKITSVEVPSERPAKEWFYIPALALLALVVWMQRRRATAAKVAS
jgi:hypothetical protein